MTLICRKTLTALHANPNITLAEIADEFGCAVDTVKSAIIRYDLPRRRRGSRGTIRRADIEALDGVSQKDMAARLGVTPSAVSHAKKRMDLR